MIRAVITNGFASDQQACVTPLGALVVSPISYSLPKFNNLDTISTAFNFFSPSIGKRFVITDVLLSTDNSVGVGGATVDIYEAVSADEASITTQLFRVILGKQSVLPYVVQNLIANEGVWTNAKTDDKSVAVTVSGYFVKNTALVST